MKATIALGSSVPDASQRLRSALKALSNHPLLELISESEVTITAAAGGATLQPFANAAAVVETRLSPSALLQLLHALEADAGRLRTRPLGPRTLDLDLLEVEGWPTLSGGGVTLPHPGRERPYAKEVAEQAQRRASSSETSTSTSPQRRQDQAREQD